MNPSMRKTIVALLLLLVPVAAFSPLGRLPRRSCAVPPRRGLLDSFFPGASPSSGGGGRSGGPTNEVVGVVDGIRQKRLGGTDIVVSEVGLGTQRWGSADANAPDKAECFKMMDLAIRDSGVNLIDTAEQYPIPSDLRRPEGSTEEIIGEWVAQGGAARRDGVVLATKITGGARISRRGLIDAVDGSLRRLKTDRIDLLQTHWPARYSPQSNWGQSLMYRKSTQRRMGMDFADFDEITQTLGELVAAGKIRGYGFCNDNSVGLVACAEAAKRLNVAPPCVMQNDFSIINRRIEENGVAEASAPWHYNAGFFAYNALAGGVLSGKYLEDPPAWERPRGRRGGLGGSGDAFGSTPGSSSGPGGLKRDLSRFDDESWGRTLYRYRSGPADDATRAYAALAKQYGLGLGGDEGGSGNGDDGGALTELALRWCCGREAVTSVLLGATSAEQLSRGLAVFKKVGSGGKAGNLLPDELEWSIDQVHMRNRLPIFSNDDVATVSRGIGTGGIGEPIP